MEKVDQQNESMPGVCSLKFTCFVIITSCLIILLCYLTLLYSYSNLYSSLTLINNNGNNKHYEYKHKLHKYYNISIEKNHSNNTYLRLMSFNLRNALLDSNAVNEYKHWDLRKNIVYSLLNNIQSDIIGTQEGILSQIEDIAYNLQLKYGHYGNGRLPTEWYLSQAADAANDMNEHCTIFWNKNKFKIKDEGTFWLSNEPNVIGSMYPNAYLPRIASWILFEIRNNDKYKILFISTHLGLTSAEREGQIKLITKFVHEMIDKQQSADKKELLVFVVGDFNEGLNGELWNNLFPKGNGENDVLVDCIRKWQELQHKKLNINITFHAFQGIEHIKNDKNFAPIDWILCSKNVMENEDIILLDTYVITKTRLDYKYKDNQNHTIYPSDHFPIVLELVLLTDDSLSLPQL